MMENRIRRIYVDTTVVLGNFDIGETRRLETDVFWNAVRNGEIVAVVSNVMEGELKKDMIEHVQNFFAELPKSQFERIVSSDESDDLAEQYIAAKVVGRGCFNDCKHVALATLFTDGVVSWNMKDMVNREEKYQNVNVAQGYHKIKIVTPSRYEDIYHET